MELSRFDRRETLSDGILVKKIKQMNNEKLKVFFSLFTKYLQ